MPRHPMPSGFRALAPAAATAIAGAASLCLSLAGPVQAVSPLLDAVKQNPALAHQMCVRFRQLNTDGQSATSKASISSEAKAQELSPMDAEILITYVIGLHCPDVR